MNRIFSSPLAAAIKSYLQLRLSLGFNIETTVATLTEFDRYLVERFPEATTVTAQIVVDYLETTRPLQSCTRHNRLSQLRQFCRFLFQLNPETYIPAAQLLPAKRVTRTPHLYTLEQVTALIHLANGLRPVGSIRPSTTAPFFINNRGRRYSRTPIKRTFSQLISQLGLKTAQGKAPRLHDFRHYAASRTMPTKIAATASINKFA